MWIKGHDNIIIMSLNKSQQFITIQLKVSKFSRDLKYN